MGKVRADMPEGCPEKFDFQFMKYIWNFPKASGKTNIDIIEKNKDKQIIVFKSRKESQQFLTSKR